MLAKLNPILPSINCTLFKFFVDAVDDEGGGLFFSNVLKTSKKEKVKQITYQKVPLDKDLSP